MLNPGDLAPEISVPDDEGRVRTRADFAEKPLVLWFFPKIEPAGHPQRVLTDLR